MRQVLFSSRIILILVFSFFIVFHSFGSDQRVQKQIDSLTKLLSKPVAGRPETDTELVNTLNILSKLSFAIDPEKALNYSKRSLSILESMKDPVLVKWSKKSFSDAYNIKASCYYVRGENAVALDLYFKALKLKEEILAASPTNKKLLVEVALIHGNIGNIYGREDEFKKSLEYYTKAMAICDSSEMKGYLANWYICIGNIYKEWSREKNDYEMINRSLEYYFKGMSIAEKIHDERRIANCYTNLGTLYIVLKNYQKADEYFKKAIDLHAKVDNKLGLAHTYLALGELELETGCIEKGISTLKSAYAVAIEIGAKRELSFIFRNLAFSDSILGAEKEKYSVHWRNAFRNFIQFKMLSDSILNEENVKELALAESKYKYEKSLAEERLIQEKQKIKSAEENRRKNIILLFVVLILFVTALFAYYIFSRFRIITVQKNVIQKQNDDLEIANREITYQKQMIQEKNKDITDSIQYARRIQKAILPHESDLKKIFSESFVLFKPRNIVSGDFYYISHPKIALTSYEEPSMANHPDVLPGEEEVAFLALADCTGHGVPGALMSMIGNNLLHDLTQEKQITSAAAVLEDIDMRLRKIFHFDESKEIKDGMDVSVCLIKPQKKKIIFSGAKAPLWLIRGNNFIEFKPNRFGIGGIRQMEIKFTEQVIDIAEGDIFYLLTDGFADQFGGPDNKKFSKRKLKELLLSISKNPVPEQKKILEETITSWNGNYDQTDDITVIGIRV